MAGMQQSFNRKANDYATLRTLPAFLSVVFFVTSIYFFGGLSAVEVTWFGGYELTTEHAMLASLAVYAAAFASSETKQFDNYEGWEQAFILAAPLVTVLWEYSTEVQDAFLSLGDPFGAQVALLITLIGWGVAVQ